jgi:hypothetical protein
MMMEQDMGQFDTGIETITIRATVLYRLATDFKFNLPYLPSLPPKPPMPFSCGHPKQLHLTT